MKRDHQNDEEEPAKYVKVVYSNAFKFLAPDSLASEMIGPKGATIQDMQNETECRISIAERDSNFGDTNLRLVLVRSQSADAIDTCMKTVVEKMALVVERIDDHDVVSKEGKLKLKVVVPKAAAAAVIGPSGSNVKEITETTGVRIRVEEVSNRRSETAEQVISLVGTAEGLPQCVGRINGFVQEVCSGEAYFQDWIRLVSASKGKGKGSINMGHMGKGAVGGGSYGSGDEGVLMHVMRQMNTDLTDKQTFALQASLPLDCMSAMIGKRGSGTQEINNQTGATVTYRNDDPNCTVLVEGPLHRAVAAYMLVMKRFVEIDAPEDAKAGKGKGRSKGGSKGQRGKAHVGM